MNRRHLLQLSVMAALAPAQQLQAAKKAAKDFGSPKKGLGYGMRAENWRRTLEELRCKWFYSWTANIPDDPPKGISYTPMIFRYEGDKDSIIQKGKAAKRARIADLLGFNEPDGPKQGNTTVEKALEAWPILEQTGLRLGSPACVHPDNEWMTTFMNEVKKRKLRVDFVCMHSYGPPDPDHLINRLKTIYKLYRKPIWITEFAVGDWKAKSVAENEHNPETVLRFMEDVLPELDRLDFIERYAWFPAKPDNKALGTSALLDAEGKLTRLGECYRDA
jgi:hypothetical protein